MIDQNNDLILHRINKAHDSLREAMVMAANEFWNAAVNRIYYACYYAVSALLLKKSIKTQTHKGVRQMFGLHYVQKGIISRESGKFFTDLYDRRQTGDYDDYIVYSKETVEALFIQAKVFIDQIEQILNQK